ncbi:Cof-type HAD-IIB family hydrolase [Laedolimicola ammoniilytica]|uniref:Cof-type HAD-IIB family hydrolase n=1 Tax=Laedolimicola ammoniilytica TaxID=2981771 RepID=A0ABT2RYM4_9FIRM|nr:Cof-type HAD-IIB family hydrolase [Laedolimicola ammoniilytica]MCU6697428.1 Cof-type HAD-IIB family hydrolase [Laedolimicola ammoniilytica]SCI26720.1 Uncharacterized phosphatase YwpJ [uncultured Clostridium sp.]
MSIRLIAFDLDGTLLKEDKTVSGRTMAALQNATDRGIYLVPSTGRIYDGMPDVVKNMPFVRYAITVNGAQIYDVKEKRILHRAELTRAESEAVFAYGRDWEVLCGCYQNGQGLMEEKDFADLRFYAQNVKAAEMMKQVYRPLKNMEKRIFDIEPTIQKIQYYFREIPERNRRLPEMKAHFPNLEISTSLPNNIEINSAKANKGLALKFLCGYLGIGLEECMAFGDGTNDLALLKTAGRGMAMANADPEVLKATAYHTACTNEEDGVAIEIETCLKEV